MAIRKYVTENEYRAYLRQFSRVRNAESLHRDDTDFHTWAEVDGKEVLIGWADYYWKFWYIFLH
ncbi:hypothetical protein DH20_14530 [Pantoea agglomerans]|nr:hypothetical protein [Pantoea agglomerans]